MLSTGNSTAAAAAQADAQKKLAQQQATAALQAKYMPQDYSTVESDLQNNNFTGAWNTALQSSGLYDQNGYQSAMQSQTTDPLLGAMENNVSSLDPSKQWTPAETSQFYNAFNQQGAYHGQQITGQGGGVEALGADPSGLWGNSADIASGKDAAANEATSGDAPDVARFAGARPTQSFLSKYGGDIVSVVGDVAGSFVGDPMAGNQVMGLYDATQGNWTGALGNLASSVVPGLGSAAGSALNIGTTAGTALAGAAVGAAQAGLSGQNMLVGALTGGASGAVQGSGITGAAGKAISSATGLPVSLGAGLAGAATGAGIGALGGALSGQGAGNGALVGGVRGGLSAGINSLVGGGMAGNLAGGAAGTIGGALASKYLTSQPKAATPAAAPVAAPKATASVQPVAAPAAAAPAAAAPAAAAANTASTSSNIGPYSGFSSTGLGYQPMSQVNAGITNYNTYGQGPEASFFAPTPGTT